MRRPRVLVLTTYYAPIQGGVETHARLIARWLRARSYDTLVLTTRVGADCPAPRTVDGVPVHRTRPAGHRRQWAKWLALPFILSALIRLRESYDVVYCPDPRGVGVAAVIARHLFAKRLVFQAATPGALSCAHWNGALARVAIDPAGRLGQAVKITGRRIYGAADAYVCISREILDEGRAAGIAERRMLYLPHGVRLDRYRPAAANEVRRIRAELGLPQERIVCLFLGRLSREKGVLDLLEAWRRLDDASAVLALAGPDMPGHQIDVGPEARAFVARHGLSDRVRFLGATDSPARIMQAADVFVHPSYYEAFAIAVAEAMACGLAPVVSPVAGIADHLDDGENALLCEPGQPGRLAATLRRLIGDSALRNALRRAARVTAERHFDSERMATRIASLLTDVVDSHGQRR